MSEATATLPAAPVHTAHGSHAGPVAPMPPRELQREPLVLNRRSLGWISDQIAGIAFEGGQ